MLSGRRHDTPHKGIQHNDPQHFVKHKKLKMSLKIAISTPYDVMKLSLITLFIMTHNIIVTPSIMPLSIPILSIPTILSTPTLSISTLTSYAEYN
jgi:hypothetical protein